LHDVVIQAAAILSLRLFLARPNGSTSVGHPGSGAFYTAGGLLYTCSLMTSRFSIVVWIGRLPAG
jgi:hypothetical protein